MKRDNVNYLLVGIFVLSAMLALMVTIYKISRGTEYTKTFYVTYNNITGVKVGTAVTYGGYKIGEVQEVTQQGRGFKLKLALKGGWDIPEKSIARIISPGMLSPNQVNIEPSDEKKPLADGGTLVGREQASIMQVLNSVAAEVKDISDTSLKPLLKTFRKQIDAIGADLARRIPEITANANKLLGNLNQGANSLNKILGKDNQRNISTTLRNFKKVSAHMLKATSQIEGIRKRLDQLLKNANHLVKDNRPDLRRSIIALRNTMESVSSNINVIVYNLEKASRNISEFSRQLRDNPGVLLSGKSPKDKGAAQ